MLAIEPSPLDVMRLFIQGWWLSLRVNGNVAKFLLCYFSGLSLTKKDFSSIFRKGLLL